MGGVLKNNVDDAMQTAGGIRGQLEALEQKEIYLAQTTVLDGVSNAAAYYQSLAAQIGEYRQVFEADALHIMETATSLAATDESHASRRV